MEAQKAAARKQAGAAEADRNAFFTLPWPPPPVLAPAAGVARADCPPIPEAQLQPLVAANASLDGVSEELLRAVIQKESGGRPCAVSAKGALGLMQLMPETADQLGVRNPFDPAENVAAGARYLKDLLTRFKGDVSLALAAYNAGPGRTERSGGIPDIRETREYVKAILLGLK
ncbi:MAG TPA: lytic transglycosylase [Solibacterales bacterium]|nr:lytic transglycosylase [Bryobacterales bacterium]